ncbi:MAG: hypothetical protein HQ507_03870 [Candidatus Marinimicrobia bacterium]|nr:hypothetical protein [Candidatus Neomarinimicrobiota bacterium]
MGRFLIEVPHANDQEACVQAVRAFFAEGSHFLTHADWGCADHEHKAWLIVDLDSKEEARRILPSLYREAAKITFLEQYTYADIKEGVEAHLK